MPLPTEMAIQRCPAAPNAAPMIELRLRFWLAGTIFEQPMTEFGKTYHRALL